MLCARRVLEFDMPWKRNAMPCRRGGEGSRRGAKGRKAKMRLRVASHLPPVRRVLYTSLVVPAPIVCFPPGEENREHEFPTAHSFLFAVRLQTVKESRGETLLYARARMRARPLLFVFSLHSFTRLPHFVDT